MKKLLFYLFLVFQVAILSNCKKDEKVQTRGFIIAGKEGNVNYVQFNPSKIIETSRISVIKDGVVKDSVVNGSYWIDLNNDGLEDLLISSVYSYPGQGMKVSIFRMTQNNLAYCIKTLNSGDTISNSKQWIQLRSEDYVVFSGTDSVSGNWTEPKYLAFRQGNNNANFLFTWIKLQVTGNNKIEIFEYSCSK